MKTYLYIPIAISLFISTLAGAATLNTGNMTIAPHTDTRLSFNRQFHDYFRSVRCEFESNKAGGTVFAYFLDNDWHLGRAISINGENIDISLIDKKPQLKKGRNTIFIDLVDVAEPDAFGQFLYKRHNYNVHLLNYSDASIQVTGCTYNL